MTSDTSSLLPITVRLFGHLEVSIDGQPLPRTRTRKEKWLLALLVLAREQSLTRQALTQKLWPDAEENYALDPGYNLRRSLSDLRRVLGTQAIRIQTPDVQLVQFDLTDVAVDVFEFDQLMRREKMPPAERMEKMMLLYRGALLEECTEEWIEPLREKYQQKFHRALLQIGEQAIGDKDYDCAIRCLRHAATLNQSPEQTRRALMRAYAQVGNYEAALRLYTELVEQLQASYNTRPSAETVETYQTIQEQKARTEQERLSPVPSAEEEEARASSQSKRAVEKLVSAHREWMEYGRSDAFFLPQGAVRVILPFLNASHFTHQQLEFLLCSVLYAAHSADDIERAAQLISATDDFPEVLTAALQHPHARIRLGAMTVATQMPHETVANSVIARLRIETDNKVKRQGVRSIAQMGQQIPKDLATTWVEKETDWLLRSYALQRLTEKPRCLFIGDGTDFARHLGDLAQQAGFEVIDGPATLMLPAIERADRELLQTYRLVLLVRGEHFSQWGNAPFFVWLKEYVSNGGKLLATSWVSWETSGTSGFADILPFQHIKEGYTEDVLIECQPAQHPWGQRLFPQPFVYRGSFEQLKSRKGSVTLAETSQGVPVFGYREVEQGVCYYLNTCQHTCFGEMLSPLQTCPSLRDGMMRFFETAQQDL